MEIEATKKVSKTITVDHKCDVCGKLAGSASMPNTWHDFSHSHGGWGNDSVDSFVYFEVCSVDCFIKQLEQSVKELSEYSEYDTEVSGMTYGFAKQLLKRLKA
jgi:hypothetical protein